MRYLEEANADITVVLGRRVLVESCEQSGGREELCLGGGSLEAFLEQESLKLDFVG